MNLKRVSFNYRYHWMIQKNKNMELRYFNINYKTKKHLFKTPVNLVGFSSVPGWLAYFVRRRCQAA